MATPAGDLSGGPVLLSLSLGTAFFALATTFVRFAVRAGIEKRIGADDYASGVATVVALVGTIFGIIEATTTDPTRAMEFDVLGQPWYLMSDTLSKISICLLFIFLLRGARQWRILLSALIFMMAAVNFSFALTVNLQCRPLEKLWKPSVDGACWDPNVQKNFGFFQGAFSVFTWFFLALFPVLIMRDLNRDGSASWPFYASSALSFACGIFTIVRTAKTAQIGDFTVYTFNTFCVSLMSNLEQNFGLMAANVLTLGPLFSAHTRRQLSSSRRGGGKTPSSLSPSRAGSTRSITRTDSRSSSSRRSLSALSRLSREIEIDLKRTTHLIIQGPRRGTPEPISQGSSSFFRNNSQRRGRDDDEEVGGEEYDLGDGRRGSLEWWPRGIIKTVSVEVVEEHNPDHDPNHKPEIITGPRDGGGGGPSARSSGGSAVEQDWEAILRAGPPAR